MQDDRTLGERLDRLRELIKTPDFLEGRGLSNEVNIQMFCYDPKDEMQVRAFANQLMHSDDLGCRLIEYNLYRVFLDICGEKGIADKVPALEAKKGSAFILGQLERVANTKEFVRYMRNTLHGPGNVVLVTGVGEAFPFIRVHALLEAMQQHFADVPVVVLYPGTYDGHQVQLFGRLEPNSYYRAFNTI